MSDFVTEVESGDRRRGLEALRKRLADEIATGEYLSRDLPALTRQLSSVMADLAKLGTHGGSVADELKAKRAAREAADRPGAASTPQRRTGRGGTG